jgi:hypothetical protein
MAAGEAVLDPQLALKQPVHRPVEVVLIGALHAEVGAERRAAEGPRHLEL